MLDIKWIRENPQDFDTAMKARGTVFQATDLIALDESRRSKIAEVQDLQNAKNALSKRIGMARGKGEDTTNLMIEANQISENLPRLEDEEKEISQKLESLLAIIPNVPFEDVPVGSDESANVQVHIFGEKPQFDFTPQEHGELGEALGLMDFEAAAKMSGARFVVLKGDLARLERAIGQFMLDTHRSEFGYEEISPPYLVRDNAVYGVGQLPKFAEDLFQTTNGYWLISTSEVSLTNLVADEIVDYETLPRRYMAYTPCFRSEAGSAGKDTKGMLRQHQFHKVELVGITTPEDSKAEHNRMLKAAQNILEKLGLHYRTLVLSTGDMGSQSKKTYDNEVWLPGQNAYREISSTSNCGDYQARRMNARMRDPEGGKKTKFVHTLNGSGLAIGRTLLAIMENYQEADGSIRIPSILQPYMGGQTHITKRTS
ncbi:Serine--tRNA ligase [Candidatus Bealeia paramacronuclearis]|uniref:Serine--tRNA ligase n=1 Tax=Candidatus Bealeia paramacronuclearis TaxID=1921001 RepID=A0ABZ2C150_9PROT|nr:Serine--tRNA ligase [Candidatus Bealeia paramacronuclearis]